MTRIEELRRRFVAHQKALAEKRAALAADDPVSFARLAGVKPDPWQERVLRSKSKRMLLNCCRQAGKSTTASILAAHRAIYKPKSLVLLVSPSQRQSGELFRKVASVLRSSPQRVELVEDNSLSTELSNGSRIVSLPSSEDTIRGYSAVDLIVEDEAAMVGDDLYAAMRPMLAVSGGQLVLMSTPKGRRGHFFEAWEHGGEAWERVEIGAREVPRIAEDFLVDERRALGEAVYRQEYECQFLNAASGLVYRFDEDKNVLPAGPACTYTLLGIDYGFNDETAFCVLGWRDYDPTVYVLECHKAKELTPSAAAEVVHELERQYHPVRIVADTSGLGKGYAEEARRRFTIPIDPADKNNKRGYIDLLNDALREGRIKVVRTQAEELLEEWRSLVWDDRRMKEAQGFPNHCADATLYGWRACVAYGNRPEEERPKRGTPEFLAAEEAKMEQAVDDELDRESRGGALHFKRRWYRGTGLG